MTVAELIAKLSELPPDMPIVTPGFDESGYDLVSRLEVITLKDVQGSGHEGRYEEVKYLRQDQAEKFAGAQSFDAVVISF